MSRTIDGTRTIAEVCAFPTNDGARLVGLVVCQRQPDRGWNKFSPDEARELAAALVSAADEVDTESQ